MIDYNNLKLPNTGLKGRSFNKNFVKKIIFLSIICVYIYYICTVCPNKRLDVCTGLSNKKHYNENILMCKIFIFSHILLKQGRNAHRYAVRGDR